MFKKIIYNTTSQIIGKAITASTTLLVTILIGRSLGPAGYGEFTKIFVFVGYFYTLSDLGLNSIYVKELKNNQIALLKALIGLRLLLGLALALSAIFISFFLPYNSLNATGFSPIVKTGILLASLTIITQALFTSTNAYFQKNLRYDLSTIAAICGSLVILVATLIVSLTNPHLLDYVTVYIFGGIASILMAFFLIARKSGQIILPKFSTTQSAKMIKASWPIGLALIFNLVYFRLDVFILANVRSSYEVGLYGLAYQFFEAALAVPIFFANALYPLLINLYQKDILEFKKQLNNWFKILTLVSLLLTVSLIVISVFIPLIFDRRFTPSVSALQILSLGMPFFFISALLWHVLIIYGKQRFLISIYAAGAAINLIANVIFIPVYGYLAAAWITIASEALIMSMLTFAYIANKRQLRLK